MNVYQNGQNWVIEEKIDLNLVEKILSLIDENLHNLLKDKNGYSTKGENADQYWLNDGSFQFNNKKFEEIKTQYKKEIITKLEKSTLLNTKIFNCINLKDSSCWSVIGEENSYHAIHCHNVNKLGVNGISTVLYLKVPQKNSQKDPGNDIFLIMGSEINVTVYEMSPRVVTITPEIGKLLIFPVWLLHGTYPQSKGIRQTFNMDFTITNETSQTNINYS